MTQVKINDSVLRKAAEAGMDEFVQAFVDAIRNALGGELNAQNMAELNSDQITLLAWDVLHQEMMDGGMVQLIHMVMEVLSSRILPTRRFVTGGSQDCTNLSTRPTSVITWPTRT